MRTIEVETQAELDKALRARKADELIVCLGNGYFELSGSAQVRAYDSAQVTASKFVAVTASGQHVNVKGGVLIELPRIESPKDWLDFYGLVPRRGVVTLYKAVTAEFRSGYGWDYTPGTKPEAPDFDPAPRDCGAGLHGCVLPVIALGYMQDAAHFVAIPVKVADLGAPDPDGDTSKIRFRRACKPVYEVDIDGEPIPREAVA